jgi:anthranilate phosphoribosyltransferase
MTAFEDAGGWPGVLVRLFHRQDLGTGLATAVFEEILAGQAQPEQIAAFAAALRTKGETVEELTGFVSAMFAHAELVELGGDLVDTCGTGGDRSGTINVSTMAACVVAGAGGRVCKHGGRAASSRAGSADVLQALGVVVDLGPSGVRRCVEEVGFGFCFAPRFHPAMRHAAPVRRRLGAPTVFNLLGPLANPARANRQVVGVGEPAMAETILGVLESNGAVHAMVLYGHDGLDELSTVATSTVLETRLDESGWRERRSYEVDARELGLPRAELAELAGGDPEDNARHARAVLDGERGPRRDVVLLNAAAGLVVAGLAVDLAAGVDLAAATLDSGAAKAALESLVQVSTEAAREEAAAIPPGAG